MNEREIDLTTTDGRQQLPGYAEWITGEPDGWFPIATGIYYHEPTGTTLRWRPPDDVAYLSGGTFANPEQGASHDA